MSLPGLRPDTLRTLVSVDSDGEVAVALHERLPREMVRILDARPDEVAEAVAACNPYPWVLVSRDDVGGVPPATILLNGMRFGDLVSRLRGMLTMSVGGMRLAPGMGVELPDGTLLRSAGLQALLSAHPDGVPASMYHFRAATQALAMHAVGWRPGRDPALKTVVLAEQAPRDAVGARM
ncbi:MAG: hypothetical protein ABR498_02505 [Candidatus Dormibacteria bacterium]